MHQQINLYQPIFRQERKLFSLATVGWSLLVVAFALVAMWGVSLFNVNKLAKSLAELEQRQADQQKMAQAASALFDAQGNPAQLQAVVQVLSAQLAERNRALEILRSGAAGEPRGFAQRLAALARHHTEGVWLEELMLGGGANGLVLRGRCVSAELVPKYLQLLTMEPELSGARFDDVLIDRGKVRDKVRDGARHGADREESAGPLRFSVSSKDAQRLMEPAGS